ncbi:MAG TPA: hypothetical protein VMT68_13555 [Caulobacteraceae bacterium]|nr:hypothetical protein [Caulobacteraceae bacterium]
MSVTPFKLPAREPAPGESIADKIRRLQEEAQGHARSHSQTLVDKLVELESLAEEIAGGGEAYPVGIREAVRKLGPELMQARLNVGSILARGV